MAIRLPLVPALAAALLAACSSADSPSPRANEQDVGAGVAAEAVESPAEAAPATPPARPAEIAAAAKGERRCGWLVNPTPANWWLTDRDGQWVLATQGADQAPGMDEMPDMSTAGWVETNGHYGYGCACMTITADAGRRVTRIADAAPKPLEQCQADRKLPKPE
ncbi:MAG TPA: DUF4087 domain-containing protein [Allosphingosinicella sp.]|nr:DUF4087 domain-containing protein [Allosphingosinicella sp.]